MQRILHWLVLGIVFVLNLVPVTDTDFGWHYRCGIELLQGNPCIANRFSYYLADYQWYNPSFLFDGITALVFDSAGFAGLSILHAMVMTGVFYLIYLMSKRRLIVSALGYWLVISLSSGTLGIGWRSQIITYALFMFSYYLLTRNKWLAYYPFVLLLWVNAHVGYFIGIALYVIYAMQSLVYAVIKQLTWKQYGLIIMIGIISVISTCINPFGWRVYLEIYRHAQAPLHTMIAEWVAPHSFQIISMIFMYLIVIIMQATTKRITLFECMVLFLLLIMALMAHRNVPLFYTVAVIQLLPLLPPLPKNLSYIALPPLIAGFVFILYINTRTVMQFHNNWDIYCTQGKTLYPCEVLENYPQLTGNIFVTYEYGGFMIWQKPQAKVFIDGRMSAWHNNQGEYAYQTYLAILQAQDGWNEVLRKHDTDFLLINQGTFLDLLLDEQAEAYGWSKVYENQVHSLFKASRS